MILGAMNNPLKPLIPQIQRYAELGFGFIDLTCEWPEALPAKLIKDEKKIKDALSTGKLGVVGHTVWYLPYSSPYPKVRNAAVAELKQAIEALSRFNPRTVTVHPDVMHFSYKNRDQFLSHLFGSIGELDEFTREMGMTLVFEPYDEASLSTAELQEMFKRYPKVGFHLDVGHANFGSLNGDRIFRFINLFKSRLMHVHASDNDGKGDQHLPIGAGKIKWAEACAALKKANYDKTVTLEVFSQDPDFLPLSKKKFQEIWDKAKA